MVVQVRDAGGESGTFMTGSRCEECGALTPEGRAECQNLFEEVLAKEFGDFRYARFHRLTVDAYSLQHPRRYMRSDKSFVAHLTGMFAALECDDPRIVNQAMQRWLNGARRVERPGNPPPRKRGQLTIEYVLAATDAEEHLGRVREWARSAWGAWGAHHSLARQWIDRAIRSGSCGA